MKLKSEQTEKKEKRKERSVLFFIEYRGPFRQPKKKKNPTGRPITKKEKVNSNTSSGVREK